MEARRPHRGRRGASRAPARDLRPRDGRQLRVPLLLAPLPGRLDRVPRARDRDHGRRAPPRGRAAATARGRPAHLRAVPPALPDRAAGHGRRRAATTPSRWSRPRPPATRRATLRARAGQTAEPLREPRASRTTGGRPSAAGRWSTRVAQPRRHAVAYKLVPGAALPHMLPEDSPCCDRRGAAPHAVGYAVRRRRALALRGFPNQSAPTTACRRWTAAGRSIEDTDVVLWYVFGIHHITRTEDWPIMPVDTVSFWLKPFGFFDRNPTLDVPPRRRTASADVARSHCRGCRMETRVRRGDRGLLRRVRRRGPTRVLRGGRSRPRAPCVERGAANPAAAAPARLGRCPTARAGRSTRGRRCAAFGAPEGPETLRWWRQSRGALAGALESSLVEGLEGAVDHPFQLPVAEGAARSAPSRGERTAGAGSDDVFAWFAPIPRCGRCSSPGCGRGRGGRAARDEPLRGVGPRPIPTPGGRCPGGGRRRVATRPSSRHHRPCVTRALRRDARRGRRARCRVRSRCARRDPAIVAAARLAGPGVRWICRRSSALSVLSG